MNDKILAHLWISSPLTEDDKRRLADMLSAKAVEILKGEPIPRNVVFTVPVELKSSTP